MSAANEIKKGKGCFYVGENEDNCQAIITYRDNHNGSISVDHTFVSQELRGQKLAARLLDKVIEMCQEDGLKIIPVCSYVRSEFEKNRDYDGLRY